MKHPFGVGDLSLLIVFPKDKVIRRADYVEIVGIVR
jgi:hypothetical protein